MAFSTHTGFTRVAFMHGKKPALADGDRYGSADYEVDPFSDYLFVDDVIAGLVKRGMGPNMAIKMNLPNPTDPDYPRWSASFNHKVERHPLPPMTSAFVSYSLGSTFLLGKLRRNMQDPIVASKVPLKHAMVAPWVSRRPEHEAMMEGCGVGQLLELASAADAGTETETARTYRDRLAALIAHTRVFYDLEYQAQKAADSDDIDPVQYYRELGLEIIDVPGGGDLKGREVAGFILGFLLEGKSSAAKEKTLFF